MPVASARQSPHSDKLLIESIDVEGGAATLYITPEHRSLLIDSGWSADIGAKDPDSAQRIIASARRHGLSKLDYVLITHYHVDHVGGVPELLSQFPVGTVLDHGPNRETPAPDSPPTAAAFQPVALYPKYLGGHSRAPAPNAKARRHAQYRVVASDSGHERRLSLSIERYRAPATRSPSATP